MLCDAILVAGETTVTQQPNFAEASFSRKADQAGSLAPLLPALGLALATLAILAYGAFRPGPPGSPIAAIYAPGTAEEAAFAAVTAAGGLPIRNGGFDNIVVARADDPGFAGRLVANGAWLVVDAVTLGACLRR
jgi:hypothetical protein